MYANNTILQGALTILGKEMGFSCFKQFSSYITELKAWKFL